MPAGLALGTKAGTEVAGAGVLPAPPTRTVPVGGLRGTTGVPAGTSVVPAPGLVDVGAKLGTTVVPPGRNVGIVVEPSGGNVGTIGVPLPLPQAVNARHRIQAVQRKASRLI